MNHRRLAATLAATDSTLPRHARPELLSQLRSRAAAEGRTDSAYPGLCFYRVSRPSLFPKTRVFGPALILVGQGRKVARFEGRELRYDPRHFLVITGEAMFDSAVTEATAEYPYLAASLELPPEIVAKTLIALADVVSEPCAEAAPAFVADSDAAVVDAMLRLLRYVDDTAERHVLAPLAVEEIVFRLLRSDAAAAIRNAVNADGSAPKIQRAMQFMRAYFARSLSVETVARHVAMSPSHFAHRFRAIARMSPMRYLRLVRLNEARALMLSAGLRASAAAARVGYESASHFAREFKHQFGTSPTDYVRRFRGV